MRRFSLVAATLTLASLALVAACVGDDPYVTVANGTDAAGTGDGPVSNTDGAGSGDSSTADGATGDGGGDAGPVCGYPGEDCCAAPSLPCNAGATCSTGTNKCLVNELAAVGVYLDLTAGVRHVASAFYDGKAWTKGPDVITETSFSGYSTTDLISAGPGNFHITLFKSSEGKLFNFYSNQWRKCEPGQACPGPTLPPPAFWSVARTSSDTWIGATNAIYRCIPGTGCTKEVTGLETTTWGTGKLVGKSSQDLWFSALNRAFHFDGTKWTIHDNLKARTIFEVSKNDVWVGDSTLQHWDGVAWSAEQVVSGNVLPGIITSMSGSSSKDVWAVGYNSSNGSHPAFAAHYNGAAWSLVTLPATVAEEPNIYAPSPTEAYLACQSGIYKWNGTTFTLMTMPTFNAGTGGEPAWSYVAGPAKPRP